MIIKRLAWLDLLYNDYQMELMKSYYHLNIDHIKRSQLTSFFLPFSLITSRQI